MNYQIIQSNSRGNALLIEDTILIDCGVSFKKLKDVYINLKLVLLTHIHSDHFNKTTIKKLAQERPTLRFGCCKWLVQDLVNLGVNKANIDIFNLDYKYSYGYYSIEPFNLIHDVPNCGYRVFANENKYLYATDTNSISHVIAKGFDIYFIEGNYENEEELEKRKETKANENKYSYEDRVKETHLSQVNAMNWYLENAGDNSSYVFIHQHIEKEVAI